MKPRGLRRTLCAGNRSQPIPTSINCLWRAVDQDDNVLDILVQSRRN